MRPTRVTLIVLIALLGVGLAAGVTYAASRLVSEPIGLAAEPHDLSSSLTAPLRPATTPATTTRTQTVTAPSVTTTAPAATAPSATTRPSTTTKTNPNSAFAPPSSSPRDGHDNDGDDD